MNPRDYLRLAERLVAPRAPSAADCRGAISRAYCAGFKVIQGHLSALKASRPTDVPTAAISSFVTPNED